MDHAGVIRELMNAVARACDPAALVSAAVEGRRGPIRGVAVGKAAAGMVAGVRRALGPHGWRGPVIVPDGAPDVAVPTDTAPVIVAGHPLPDGASLRAGRAAGAAFDDPPTDGTGLVLLLSGGASSLMADPFAGVTLEDYRAVVSAMLRSGATIHQLNAVRKHLDRVKGGRLAARAHAARPDASIEVLVISDVPGDDLSVIGSGPCAPDPTTRDDAVEVLRRCDGEGALDVALERVRSAVDSPERETPKAGDPCFQRVTHAVLASNGSAVAAAADFLRSRGFAVAAARRDVQGAAAEAGRALARAAWGLAPSGRPTAIVWGGETTVDVRGTLAPGFGGRNQELALAAALELEWLAEQPGQGAPWPGRITVASFGTDGVDGVAPQGARPPAGALVHAGTRRGALAAGLAPAASLAAHDSFGFFAALAERLPEAGGPIVTGPTGTNINDISVALVEPA
ncbi:MAG: DUF4147 domain-containing protein [Phycisphaerae bacterium]|nr:DUF4147 domain-containing protein [Phycisphaerae bacterium]